jgi:hypothetical protein
MNDASDNDHRRPTMEEYVDAMIIAILGIGPMSSTAILEAFLAAQVARLASGNGPNLKPATMHDVFLGITRLLESHRISKASVRSGGENYELHVLPEPEKGRPGAEAPR